MKNSLFLTLTLSCLLCACGDKKPAGAVSDFKNKIVLGAFNDNTSPPTLDLTKLQDLPKVVDFSNKMTPVKNQSTRGTCTFFSTMSMLEGSINIDLSKEVNLSEEFLNYNTKNAGHYSTTEGSTVYHNILSIKKSGLLLERDYGYEPSWFEKGFPCGDYKADGIGTPKKCYSHNSPDENALKKVISTNGINFKSLKKNTNEIIKFLAREQRPLTISLTVNFNGWPNSGETFYNEDLRAECLAKPSDCGGHSVALTGYDMEKKVFFFKNSWGAQWGSKGFGTVTFDTVDRYVVDDLNYALVSELELPEDFKDDKLNLASFDFVSSFDQDNSYKIKVTGEVNQAQGRPLYISSFVVTKYKDDTRPINDMSVSVVNISETSTPQYLKTLNYLGHGSSSTLVWNAENPLVLTLDSTTMQSEKVLEIINDTEIEALLRTTIYVHTDDHGYKTLKRIYRSL